MRLLWWAAIVTALLVAVASVPLAAWAFTSGETSSGFSLLISGASCCFSAYVLYDLRPGGERW